MPPENPYESPAPLANDANPPPPTEVSAGRAAYNIVSDTVGGLNVRKSDNLFQLKCIGVAMLVLASLGAWYAQALVGALVGAFAGLIVGVFGSGIFLMFYRAARHLRGKHE